MEKINFDQFFSKLKKNQHKNERTRPRLPKVYSFFQILKNMLIQVNFSLEDLS